MDLWMQLLAWALPSGFLSSVATWLVTRRRKDNDFLSELQSSINLLSTENKKILAENIQLRRENVDLKANQEEMLRRMDSLSAEIARLRRAIGKRTSEYDEKSRGDARRPAVDGLRSPDADAPHDDRASEGYLLTRAKRRSRGGRALGKPDAHVADLPEEGAADGTDGADSGADDRSGADGGEPP